VTDLVRNVALVSNIIGFDSDFKIATVFILLIIAGVLLIANK
jgi:hypothetical protein